MSVVQRTLAFSFGTLLSRLTGLVRDTILASVFGASTLLDAYYVAIIFPFFLRRTFAEGAMTSAFLPLYNNLETEEEKQAFVSAVLTSLGLVTLSITVFVEIFPSVIPAIFSTGASGETKLLATRLIRITAPFVVLEFVWALFYALHNSQHRYFLPAMTPLFSNVGVMVGALTGSVVLATWGFTLGNLVAVLVLLPRNFRYRPTLKGLGNFYKMFLVTSLTMATSQVTTLVDTNVASFLGEGSLSLVQLAGRIYQLPLGIFGVAVSTVALSTLSQTDDYEKDLRDLFTKNFFFTLPASLGLFLLSRELITLFFGYGAFGTRAVEEASKVLAMYAPGLLFVSVFNLLSRARHAALDTKTPFVAMLIVSVSNAILDVVLGFTLGASGIALATTLSSILGTTYLILRHGFKPDWRAIIKIAIASGVMGVFTYSFKLLFRGRIWTVTNVALSVVLFLIVGKILKIEEVRELKSTLLR